MVRIRVQSVRVLWENGLAGPNDGETHDTGTLLPMQSTRTALLFAALVTIGGCTGFLVAMGPGPSGWVGACAVVRLRVAVFAVLD